MQEVGELHVDRFHGARVLHDPMFVHIGGIVVARGAERAKGKEKGDGYVKKMHYLGFIVLPFNSRRSPKNILDVSTSERVTAKHLRCQKHLSATFHKPLLSSRCHSCPLCLTSINSRSVCWGKMS